MSKSCGGACGGDATSAADTDIQASSEAPGRWVSVYAVPKMDCPSEERMIRLALNGFEEIRALSFDLSNRRLKVVHDGEVEPVTSKLKTLGARRLASGNRRCKSGDHQGRRVFGSFC